MEIVNNEPKRVEEIRDNYENIRLALSGLMEIIKINHEKDDFYYKAGLENLKGIKANLLKILANSYSQRQINSKLREIDFDEELEVEESSLI
jgi:hypothetical protein